MKRRKILSILLTLSLLCLSLESGISTKKTDAASVFADSLEGERSDSEEPLVTESPEVLPSQTPESGLLKTVTKVKIKRYSTTAAKITWKKVKKAKYYRVYVSRTEESGYHLKGITKKTHFLAKNLKNHNTYYFYVQACKKKKSSAVDSMPSAKVHMKTKNFSRKTFFAGDSITTGIAIYLRNHIPIGGRVRTVATKGLGTRAFRSRRVFKGKTGLQKIVSAKPYRVYLMLGMNDAGYMKLNSFIQEYKHIIQSIKKASPDTDIVVCAVSPVTRSKRSGASGYKRLPRLNKMLKKLAKRTDSHFFDYTGFMKNSDGCLKSKYAAGNGYHWQPKAYKIFAKKVKQYEKSLDD